MNFEKYTDKAKLLIKEAYDYAIICNNELFSPEHLLKALIDDHDKICTNIIIDCGGDLSKINKHLTEALNNLPKVLNQEKQINLSIPLAKIFSISENISKKNNDTFVRIEYIFQALYIENTSRTSEILKLGNVNKKKLENTIININKNNINNYCNNKEDNNNILKKYTRNLTIDARIGKLDPVIGRDEEIRRVIQVLSRRIKNNPVLIGEPGVGKTAIAEGLAIRIINEDVPESIRDKNLLMLDLGSIIAGAKYRGEFEERLRSILSAIKSDFGKNIIFIDELHTIIGAGRTDGAMDASNLLKPALARGDLHCIGATTIVEYRKYIEKDAAFARRFQPVFVKEPTVEDTISILRGIKEKYEQHHKVRISDSSLIASANLAKRYITDRFFPDKAIDLIDESASRLRMQVDSKPEELDKIDRKIMQLKIEREAIKNEKDKDSLIRLKFIDKELNNLNHKSSIMTTKWHNEKRKLYYVTDLKKQIDDAKNDLSIAQRNGEFQKAGELAYGKIPNLQKKLKDAEDEKISEQILEETVTPEHIAQIISKWTGIPVHSMLEGEKRKLLRMEYEINKRVVGQEEAVNSISRAIRRSRSGLQDPNKPIGSFMFLGPTGVGKTELTKTLANFLFQNEKAIMRIDMSEFMEKHSVSRLIGAPPGYVGYEEGGILTESIRRRPYQVILFDEIEKAHIDVFNILLQVLDDGRLTDSQGNTVFFNNTLIIMTSNIGSDKIMKLPINENTKKLYNDIILLVKNKFLPEFINRIDEIILFSRLSHDAFYKIIDIQLFDLQNLLNNRKITLHCDKKAKQWLHKKGYDPIYGARPLKRVIQKYIKDPLSDIILKEDIINESLIFITCTGDNLSLSLKKTNN